MQKSEIIIIDSEAYYAFLQETFQYFERKYAERLAAKPLLESDWIDWRAAQELLPLKSKGSWQRLRDLGEIEFTQANRLILYSRKSILKYLEKHKK